MQNKRYKRRRPSARSQGKPMVSNAVKKYVKTITAKQRPEMKKQFNLIDEQVLNTLSPSFFFSEFIVAQGTPLNGRVGNEVLLQGCHIKGVLHNNSNSPVYVRRLVLGFSDGTITNTFTELFTSAGGVPTDLGTTTGLNSMYYSINKVKFKVYDDTMIRLGSLASIDGNNTRFFNKFQKFGGCKIKYEGNTNGEQNQNKRFAVVWLVAQADDDTSSGVPIELSSSINWYFTDP